MTEIDDKMINQFFQAEKEEIKDNGFSRRVMRNLPDRGEKLSKIWAAFCTAIGIVLFFLFNGLEAILNILREAFNGAMQSGIAHLDIKSLLLIVLVFIGLGVKKVCQIA
ncbi:DUF5056 domain-containing protein [uncultured Bacteroides sp.]|uniref:DUF5056 domain-containing protein n=1 Tax=uncultured Bacteroides sp. TaxID=162156 RepID=UPI002AABAADF|nr:DUF5056 domain-containing protein [uncultured Bacteroides sp.]